MSSVPRCFDISSVILLGFLHSQVDDFVLIKNCFRQIIVAIVIIFFTEKTNIEKNVEAHYYFWNWQFLIMGYFGMNPGI